MRKSKGSHGSCSTGGVADVPPPAWTTWPRWRGPALLTGVAVIVSALIMAGPAAVAAPAEHARPAGTVAVKFTASVRGHRCVLRAAGRKDRGYLVLRVTRDTCRPSQLRIRAAGQGVLPDRTYYGNWVDKTRQLTSINIAPNVYSDFGYDWQCNWPRHAAHRCKVRYVSEDTGAAVTLDAAAALLKVYGPHGNQCFKTNSWIPTQWDYWSPPPGGIMTTIPHLKHCTAFSYNHKSENLLQAGSKGKKCLTQVNDGAYYVIQKCLPHHRLSQKFFFSSVDHGKRAEIHSRLSKGRGCITLNMNPLTQNPPGAQIKPEICGANDAEQQWYWQSPAKKKR